MFVSTRHLQQQPKTHHHANHTRYTTPPRGRPQLNQEMAHNSARNLASLPREVSEPNTGREVRTAEQRSQWGWWLGGGGGRAWQLSITGTALTAIDLCALGGQHSHTRCTSRQPGGEGGGDSPGFGCTTTSQTDPTRPDPQPKLHLLGWPTDDHGTHNYNCHSYNNNCHT